MSAFFFRDYASQLREERPIVVMGRGHSGTRVLGWALDKLGLHMGTTDENPAADAQDLRFTETIKEICRRTLHEPARSAPHPRELRRFQKRAAGYMKWLGPLQPGWGWKFPETYLIGNYVEQTFPKAVYIHMVRDGRDVAFKEHSTDRPGRLGSVLLKHIDAFELPHHQRAALSWQFQLERFEEFAAGLKAPLLSLKFEDLCNEPIETMKKVCDFLQVPMTEDCHNYLLTQVDPARVAQFREQPAQKVQEVEELIYSGLHRWGYV